MNETVKAHLCEALSALTCVAYIENTLQTHYTLAEELDRIQDVIGGGPFSAIGDRIKHAAVEIRLALIELRKHG